MIKVTTITDKLNNVDRFRRAHVTLEGDKSLLEFEIKALIDALVTDPELENIYLNISVEIAQQHLESLEKTLEDLKNG